MALLLRGLEREDLARIHDAAGVQGALDAALQVDMQGAVLPADVPHLAHPHAVLPARDASQGNRPGDHLVLERHKSVLLLRLVGHERVEVPVGNVGADHAGEAGTLELGLRVRNTRGELRHWHADVAHVDGVAAARTVAQPTVSHGAQVAAPASIPQLVKRLTTGSKAVRLCTPLLGHGKHRCPIALSHLAGVADKLEEECGGRLERCLEGHVCATDAFVVHEFAAQKCAEVRPHRRHHRLGCSSHVREDHDGATPHLGRGEQPHGELSDNPQCALGAEVEGVELVAGGCLADGLTGANDLALGRDHQEAHDVLLARAVLECAHAAAARGGHAPDRRV
mmetsp:Transcript_88053/g.272769  ORF Transcript_88053/g.272769 Transcript_88053/m.272769 type:complete len:338 (-) Transcript_88053:185-1198(-)